MKNSTNELSDEIKEEISQGIRALSCDIKKVIFVLVKKYLKNEFVFETVNGHVVDHVEFSPYDWNMAFGVNLDNKDAYSNISSTLDWIMQTDFGVIKSKQCDIRMIMYLCSNKPKSRCSVDLHSTFISYLKMLPIHEVEELFGQEELESLVLITESTHEIFKEAFSVSTVVRIPALMSFHEAEVDQDTIDSIKIEQQKDIHSKISNQLANSLNNIDYEELSRIAKKPIVGGLLNKKFSEMILKALSKSIDKG